MEEEPEREAGEAGAEVGRGVAAAEGAVVAALHHGARPAHLGLTPRPIHGQVLKTFG